MLFRSNTFIGIDQVAVLESKKNNEDYEMFISFSLYYSKSLLVGGLLKPKYNVENVKIGFRQELILFFENGDPSCDIVGFDPNYLKSSKIVLDDMFANRSSFNIPRDVIKPPDYSRLIRSVLHHACIDLIDYPNGHSFFRNKGFAMKGANAKGFCEVDEDGAWANIHYYKFRKDLFDLIYKDFYPEGFGGIEEIYAED